jgi:hypothetical protein
MGGRYVVMGTQIGMLKSLIKTGNLDEAQLLLDEILKSQFVGNTENYYLDDIREIIKVLPKM